MSREYALSRVRDALEKSQGNHLKAQRLLAQWLENDTSLLIGLVAPHMPAVIAHALSHVMNGGDVKKKTKEIKIEDEKVGEFGEVLLSSLKGGRHEGVGFGEATPRNLARPGAASRRHVDAINAIVAGKKPPKDKSKK